MDRLRLLHTGDWHLGHALRDFSRGDEHDAFLAWLLNTIKSESVDALLICGDVFHTANPGAAAQAAWYRFLAEARSRFPDLDVVVIGPGDLSLSMGIPGGWKDPRVQTEVRRIHTAARAAGKPAMIVALDHDDGRRLLDEGYQALPVVTGPLIVNAARSFLQVLRA